LTTTLFGIESRTSRVSASKTPGAAAGSSWPAAACACVALPAVTAGADDAAVAELARDSHVRIELDVGELVVDDLELIGLDRDLHAADLPLVHGELARDAQRVLVFVEQAELLDLDAIGGEHDPRVEARVSALRQLGDGEGPIADVDRPAQVRVSW
jgi:hypothetical protein